MRAAPRLYAFMAVMWGMLLAGGGLFVLVLGPLSVSGLGEHDAIASSALKAAAAAGFVAAWVVALARANSWMFRRGAGSAGRGARGSDSGAGSGRRDAQGAGSAGGAGELHD